MIQEQGPEGPVQKALQTEPTEEVQCYMEDA